MQSVSEQGIKFKVIQNWVKLGPDTPKEDISQKPTLHSPTLPPQNNKGCKFNSSLSNSY